MAEGLTQACVVAVVVAYNRRELLRETLAALQAQSAELSTVVVIDNASTDDTRAMLEAEYGWVELTHLDKNTGGAGGFAVGMHQAVARHDADFVWVMDDDTVPTPTALEELLQARSIAPRETRIVGSRVVWTDGRDHPMNTPRAKPFASRAALARAQEHDCYPVRSASFVSLMIDAAAVRALGLPIVDYFLWNDDFEYSMRILRRAHGYIARRSVVVHKTKVFGSTDIDPGPRFRFEVRNKIWMLLRSRSLSPFERVSYTGASLLRWARTFRHSADRATLRAGLRAGVAEGFRSRPRTNASALEGSGADTAAIAEFELSLNRSRRSND